MVPPIEESPPEEPGVGELTIHVSKMNFISFGLTIKKIKIEKHNTMNGKVLKWYSMIWISII